MNRLPGRTLGPLAFLLPGLALGLIGLRSPEAKPTPPLAPTRLAVLLVFDQFRGDYLTRWDSLFGEGGFHRLEKEGAWFQDCHYPYATTVTGAGHASLATGCSPDRHGIINNEWYDRASGARVYCASSPRYQQVPPPDESAPEKTGPIRPSKPVASGAPERLRVPTLADALKDATGSKARVVSLSLKDRSAVLPGGRRPDGCYWFDSATGSFVTSTYYRDRLHPWVEEFNRTRIADRWLGKDWGRLRPDLDYEKFSSPDDSPGENKNRTFPHALGAGPAKPGKRYYEDVTTSPFGNDLLLELVRQAVLKEQLGRHDDPDLLCVSFSSNDLVGHGWGPDSQEVLDVTLRTDLIVKQLLETLDEQVGKGRYALVLSADHGVSPLPEASRARGLDARRINPKPLLEKAEAFLAGKFPQPNGDSVRPFESFGGDSIYLSPTWLRSANVSSPQAEAALADWLKGQPGILTAYTRTQLLRGIPAEDVIGQHVARSFDPDRSGDAILVTRPYDLLTDWLTGTTHGTPHEYDTHVPLLAFGPGIRPGVRTDAVTPQAAVAILALALGVKPPADAGAPVPGRLFTD